MGFNSFRCTFIFPVSTMVVLFNKLGHQNPLSGKISFIKKRRIRDESRHFLYVYSLRFLPLFRRKSFETPISINQHPSRCGFADHHTKGLKVIEVSELQKIPVQQCPISLIISLISIREISKSSDTTTVLVAELCSGPCPSKYINSPSGSPHV